MPTYPNLQQQQPAYQPNLWQKSESNSQPTPTPENLRISLQKPPWQPFLNIQQTFISSYPNLQQTLRCSHPPNFSTHFSRPSLLANSHHRGNQVKGKPFHYQPSNQKRDWKLGGKGGMGGCLPKSTGEFMHAK
jgi:hypothetical protein